MAWWTWWGGCPPLIKRVTRRASPRRRHIRSGQFTTMTISATMSNLILSCPQYPSCLNSSVPGTRTQKQSGMLQSMLGVLYKLKHYVWDELGPPKTATGQTALFRVNYKIPSVASEWGGVFEDFTLLCSWKKKEGAKRIPISIAKKKNNNFFKCTHAFTIPSCLTVKVNCSG